MANPPEPGASVSFQREERRHGYTYYIYRAPNELAAIDFLKTIEPPTRHNVYYIVETPEGNWGRDIDGVYNEG